MKLAEVVAPYELCRMMPEGMLEDSLFAWYSDAEIIFNEGTIPDAIRQGKAVPAPTSMELVKWLAENANDAKIEPVSHAGYTEYVASCWVFRKGKKIRPEIRDESLVAALMRLFMVVNMDKVKERPEEP